MPSTFYVSSLHGKESNSGLDPASAVDTWRRLKVQPGDSVLFERGSSYRETIEAPDGEERRPVRFASYGEGAKPVFYGSVDLSSPDCWEMTENRIWRCTRDLGGEPANFVFDNGTECGILAWKLSEMFKPGHWFSTHVGFLKDRKVKEAMAGKKPEHYLYSFKNPGLEHSSVECVALKTVYIATAKRHAVFEDLAFRNMAACGVFGHDAAHITVRGCEFTNVGGLVWNAGNRIRCGNAVEFWDGADDILVENCRFENVYDSCITNQGPHDSPKVPKRLHFTNNVFKDYGMGAYEARDKVGVDTRFCGNTCLGAGMGFSLQDETPPRRSEIWPRPMGHHVFLWRMDGAGEDETLTISGNSFHEAPYGAAVYSIVSPEAESHFVIRENRYFMGKKGLMLRMHGRDYDDAQFHEYRLFKDLPRREYLHGLLDELAKKYPESRVVNVVCHGHSVPAGYYATPLVDTLRAYPHLLLRTIKERFPFATVNVITTAIGGYDSVKAGPRFGEEVLCHKPDLVTLDFGLNDVRHGLEEPYAAWSRMIEACLEKGVKVILLTPTLTNQCFEETGFFSGLKEHAEQIRVLAEKYKVGLADPFRRWISFVESGGDLCNLLSHVNHPSARGHELIAEELAAFFLPR